MFYLCFECNLYLEVPWFTTQESRREVLAGRGRQEGWAAECGPPVHHPELDDIDPCDIHVVSAYLLGPYIKCIV